MSAVELEYAKSFIEGCRRAEAVTTPQGPALLIDGYVIELKANSGIGLDFAKVIASLLKGKR